LHHLRQELGNGPVGVVLDSSGSHRSEKFAWPAEMQPLYLPPYSPELNPVEQIFRHMRKKLSNTIFTTLEALQQEGPQPERLVPDPIHGSLKHHTVVVCGPHQILIAQHPWYVFDCPCEDRKEG